MKKPFYSVIIPVYNRVDKLARALSSVANQTFKDFECIVVDDGSNENSRQIISKLVKENDKRFTYIFQNNSGASVARNTGIKSSTGCYISFLDSDDTYFPDKLEKHYELIKAQGTDTSYFGFSQMIVDRNVDKVWVKPKRGPDNVAKFDEYLMCTHGWAQTSTLVVSSELAKKTLFDSNLPSSQDTDFAIRCWLNGASINFLARPLVILDDVFDSSRVSKQGNFVKLIVWIDAMKHKGISDNAYWGYRGWQIARICSYTNRAKGLKFYLHALIHRPYSMRMAILVGAQILIPQRIYQKIATIWIKLFGKR